MKNILLILASTLFCFLLLEVGLRVVGYNPFQGLLNGRELILQESDNPIMVYEPTPNSEGIAWGAPIKINSYGFRDREYALAKPDATYRIAVIGDSITFGNYLSAEETYPKRLEEMFRERDVPVEVLDLGIGGYDTAQEVEFLKKVGLQFDVDEVIVGYCMNDVGVVSTNLEYINRASTYRSPFYKLRTMQLIRVRLDTLDFKLNSINNEANGLLMGDQGDANLELPAYVTERLQAIKEYTDSNGDYHYSFTWYADARKINKVVAAFDKLRALSYEHGFKVSVVIIPFISNHLDVYGLAYDIVRHEAQRKNFDVLEVLDKFNEIGVKNLRAKPRDGTHPNELGHRIIAKNLFEFYMNDPTQRLFDRTE